MSIERVRAATRAKQPRCPVCREDLRLDEPVLVCSQEHAAIHADCVELSPRCPAIGCEERMAPDLRLSSESLRAAHEERLALLGGAWRSSSRALRLNLGLALLLTLSSALVGGLFLWVGRSELVVVSGSSVLAILAITMTVISTSTVLLLLQLKKVRSEWSVRRAIRRELGDRSPSAALVGWRALRAGVAEVDRTILDQAAEALRQRPARDIRLPETCRLCDTMLLRTHAAVDCPSCLVRVHEVCAATREGCPSCAQPLLSPARREAERSRLAAGQALAQAQAAAAARGRWLNVAHALSSFAALFAFGPFGAAASLFGAAATAGAFGLARIGWSRLSKAPPIDEDAERALRRFAELRRCGQALPPASETPAIEPGVPSPEEVP